MAACAVVRADLWTYGADTGTFAIAIHNAAHAMSDPFEGGSHFRYHWSPILVLLYPLLALTGSTLALQLVQIALVIGAVFAFYALVEPRLGRALALRCAIVALIYPPLVGLAFSEFHELAFAPLLTLLALRALSLRRWGFYAVTVALLICVREDVALLTVLYGALFACYSAARRDRTGAFAGALTCAAAAAATIGYFAVIAPSVGGWAPSSFYRYGAHDATALLPRLTYLLEIVVPLALLPLLTRWFLLALPPIAIVLLANSGEVWRMGMHYVALWMPWILLAFAAGTAAVRERRGERAAQQGVNAAIVSCVLFLVFFNPTHAAHYLSPEYGDDAAAVRALRCVPAGALVATHDEWYAALALRHPQITIGTPAGAPYLLFADDYPNREFQTEMLPEVRREVAAGTAIELCRTNRVAVYRRIRP